MSDYQPKPEVLELSERNIEYEMKLEKPDPFWSGMTKGQYPKMKYGYGLIKDITGKEKMFVSETVHELIQISGVGTGVSFKLMLKSNADKTMWYLKKEGQEWKSKYQYHDEKQNKVEEKPNESINIDTRINDVGSNLVDEIQKFKKEVQTRIEILEKKVQDGQSRPEPVSENDIPF